MPILRCTSLCLLATLAAAPLAAQGACGDSARIVIRPEVPRQGTLFTVRLEGAPPEAELSGQVAGEALHFVADSSGTPVSFAPAPIDTKGSLGVMVACILGARRDTIRSEIALAPGQYPVERLSVAPRFSQPPDSALAERMRREARRAAEVSAIAHDTPRLWSRPFTAPRSSRITSRFGRGREFNGTVTSRHMGTDYAGASGAPIRAANRGVVRLVDSFFLGGNVVYVDHGAGLVTAYLHMSRHTVAAGDTVERGQLLGRVGATGRVTGPHLHFIVRYGSVSVDPQRFLSLTGGAAAREGSGASSAGSGRRSRPARGARVP